LEYDFTPNDALQSRVTYVGREREPLLIADDFLADPEAMVRYAADEAVFETPRTAYPGIIAPTPSLYTEALLYALSDEIEQLFQVRKESAAVVGSFFGLVTIPPDQLAIAQRIPHVDDIEPGRIAALHYFCDEAQGGTAFYRHRRTGFETVTPERDPLLRAAFGQDAAEKGLPQPGYINADTILFEQIGRVDAKRNRLIVYRSRLFHSGLIGPGTCLDPNPRLGRLTVNTFLRFEPNAAS
jgi:hypothetical protein